MCLFDYILDYEGIFGKDEILVVFKFLMIVFVNLKSGGQFGSFIIKFFCEFLNFKQVFFENQIICLCLFIVVIVVDRLSVKKKLYVFVEVVLY